ncbi:MAG: hypothetical protein N3F03_05360, partial [Ignavibacteria bacterium]|nr:hypothetical protein [Ignavibacteria bacterium]
ESISFRHSCESRNPFFNALSWIPAYAGMTFNTTSSFLRKHFIFVISAKASPFVIPAKAGIHFSTHFLGYLLTQV